MNDDREPMIIAKKILSRTLNSIQTKTKSTLAAGRPGSQYDAVPSHLFESDS